MCTIPQLPEALSKLAESSPLEFSATNPDHQEFVQQAALSILEDQSGLSTVETENMLVQHSDQVPLALQLGAKLARSKQVITELSQPIHVDVVFAAYNENNRILRPEEHPSGEDFLRRKVAQLNWLGEASKHFHWHMTAVDDGCPEKCGDIIENLAQEEGYGEVSVLRLSDAIEKKLPVAAGLSSTDDSRKGGSILYGMWNACNKKVNGEHIIVFTDADLSTHLGQVGLLVDPILNQGKDVAIGSRREANSIVVKQGTRNVRGKLFIYLWKRMLSPALSEVVDTQCGFKGFRASKVKAVVEDCLEHGFAFDVELLLKSELQNSRGIAKAAIAWIDSEAESTTTALSPYLNMLKSIAAMSRKYLPAQESGNAFALLVESLDEENWNRLVDRTPSAIANGDPLTFEEFSGVSADDLRALLSDK